jgi:hypothetical protein
LRQGVHDHCVTNDMGTLATALPVRTGDLLKQYPDLAPWRPSLTSNDTAGIHLPGWPCESFSASWR